MLRVQQPAPTRGKKPQRMHESRAYMRLVLHHAKRHQGALLSVQKVHIFYTAKCSALSRTLFFLYQSFSPVSALASVAAGPRTLGSAVEEKPERKPSTYKHHLRFPPSSLCGWTFLSVCACIHWHAAYESGTHVPTFTTQFSFMLRRAGGRTSLNKG